MLNKYMCGKISFKEKHMIMKKNKQTALSKISEKHAFIVRKKHFDIKMEDAAKMTEKLK